MCEVAAYLSRGWPTLLAMKKLCAITLFAAHLVTTFSAHAAPLEIPFNWKPGNASDYALEVISERPEALGVPCIMRGNFRLEVLSRTATTADIRATPSGIKFVAACIAPSLRQTLLIRLSGTPIEATLTPSTAETEIKNAEQMRKSLAQSMRDNRIWTGQNVSASDRADIIRQLEPIVTGDMRQLAGVTGLIDPLTRFIDEAADTEKPTTVSDTLPNPFGSDPLTGSITIKVESVDKKLNTAWLAATSLYDAAAITAAFHQVGLKLLNNKDGAKADATDRASLLKRKYESYSTVQQHVNTATGWLLESHFTNTVKLDEKLLLDIVRLKLIAPATKN